MSEGGSGNVKGSAVQIVKINEEDHSFFLDEQALNTILKDEKIKEKPICVVSVAGNYTNYHVKAGALLPS